MSRMAQEFEQKLREMRAGARGRKAVNEKTEQSEATAAADQPLEMELEKETGGEIMAKRQKAAPAGSRRARTTKKTTGPRKKSGIAKGPRGGRGASRYPTIEIPTADGLRLASHGVRAEATNRYVTFEFSSGLILRFVPANLSPESSLRARDVLVEWLSKRLAS